MYKPEPIDTTDVELDKEIVKLGELLVKIRMRYGVKAELPTAGNSDIT